jgi:hypothetical protein
MRNKKAVVIYNRLFIISENRNEKRSSTVISKQINFKEIEDCIENISKKCIITNIIKLN